MTGIPRKDKEIKMENRTFVVEVAHGQGGVYSEWYGHGEYQSLEEALTVADGLKEYNGWNALVRITSPEDKEYRDYYALSDRKENEMTAQNLRSACDQAYDGLTREYPWMGGAVIVKDDHGFFAIPAAYLTDGSYTGSRDVVVRWESINALPGYNGELEKDAVVAYMEEMASSNKWR
jgi:hypothetical protein